MNDSYSIHMTPITTSNATHVELRGQFITEPENVVREAQSAVGSDWSS